MSGSFGFMQTRRRMADLIYWRDFGEEFTSTPDDSFHPPSGFLFVFSKEDMGVSKNRGKTHQNGWFISWKTMNKWMVWG